MLRQATYIWLDGSTPQTLRSKDRILNLSSTPKISDFPEWGFDGSSTNQAKQGESDLTLVPVYCTKYTHAQEDYRYLVMCEVFNANGTPHYTNKRAELRKLMENGAASHDPLIGFEQEYVLFRGLSPLGWPDRGYPAPQGPFYCGVGADEVFGRDLVEEHTQACLNAGLMIFGTNAEVMPGQWEFQIGYRDVAGETADPLTVSDHVWVARWLLYRIGEKYGISATLANKPVKGDWNGSGQHTNFSTKETRDPKTGMKSILEAIDRLKNKHAEHIAVYGPGLDERLTGLHETADMRSFSHGISTRGTSIRIPGSVAKKGYGYLEDRRPGANANPYEVASVLIKSICDMWES